MNHVTASATRPPEKADRDLSVKPARLVVVRHGETVWNAQGRWQGWLDSPLTEIGRGQAKKAAETLAGRHFDAVYSSDSPRALETTQIILKELGIELPITPSAALRERNYGGFEGLSTAEIIAKYPATRYGEQPGDTRLGWRPPGEGAEDLAEVQARIAPFFQKVAREHPGASVLVVTHSNVVRLLDSMSGGEKLEAIWDRVPPNACVFVLDGWPDGRVEVVQHFCADGVVLPKEED